MNINQWSISNVNQIQNQNSKPTNWEIVLLQIGMLKECESSVNFFSKVCELKLYQRL